MKNKSVKQAAAALVCALALLSPGCGKKGDPLPDISDDIFSFTDCKAHLYGGALEIEGNIKGAHSNVEYIVLELQPEDGELCTGCPFLAQESERFDAAVLWQDKNSPHIALTYRPLTLAQSYRIRLSGHNAKSGLPEVKSEIMIAGAAVEASGLQEVE